MSTLLKSPVTIDDTYIGKRFTMVNSRGEEVEDTVRVDPVEFTLVRVVVLSGLNKNSLLIVQPRTFALSAQYGFNPAT